MMKLASNKKTLKKQIRNGTNIFIIINPLAGGSSADAPPPPTAMPKP